MAPKENVRLTYFNGRGRGESVRFILAAAGVEFTERFLTEKSQLDKWRADGELLFMQVPMLEMDGRKVVQTLAITRHVARKYGLDGKNDEEKSRIDTLNEGAREFLENYFGIGFVPSTEKLLSKIKETVLPRYLPIFEKVLSENSSGYLVGDQLSYADVTLLEALLNTEENLPGSLKEYPKVSEFLALVSSLPQMKTFLAGPLRKGPNNAVYIKTVRTVLEF
ncbi:glutathione S-transferase A4-like [Glandiceps talaboti]